MDAEAIKKLVIYETSQVPSGITHDADKKRLVIEFEKDSLDEGVTAEALETELRKCIPYDLDIRIVGGDSVEQK